MASSLSLLEDKVTCPVCCDIFTDPVILPCSHSFCRVCIKKHWADRHAKECVICREKSSNRNPPLNLALKNACESIKKIKKDSGSSGLVPHSLFCTQHSEPLQFYCLDEEQLVCVECISQHQTHKMSSIKKAASEFKKGLEAPLKILQEKLNSLKETKLIFKRTKDHIKSQFKHSETQIEEEFEKLHQFLREEKETRLATLREEEEQKRQNMKEKIGEIDEMMSSLSETMKDIKEKMERDDALVLLVRKTNI
ncbi:nuclear factor 7, brain-like [Chanos chanos]|uniref:Nuclear factor 7, brain-like n=1 Tax=Chanos chanos TaxID=29144 RepID=A0A6J2VYW1_CHACN|nr:nuclear factor 7, brain-like [Chanos chanos]